MTCSTSEARLCGVIENIISIVDEETASLRQGILHDVARHADRKAQGLVTLNQAARSHPAELMQSRVRAQLERLRRSIENNQRHLRVNITAITEVAEMVVEAIQQESSDGTYTRSVKGVGPLR